MKTLIVNSPGSYSISDLPKPGPSAGEVLIKVRRIGLCGSDLATWRGLNPMISYPRIVGHELSGCIEELGDEVPEEFKIGLDITVVPYTSCGTCSSCRKARFNACKSNKTLGVQRDGACSEYLTVPWEKLIYEPGLSLDELVLVEPLSVGFHAAKRGRVAADDVVAVFGCGIIGLGAIAAVASKAKNIIAIDIDDSKLELARKLGAKYTINSSSEDLHNRLSEISGGDGPDLLIEAAGQPATFRAAVDEAAFSGRVVYIGYAKDEVEYETRIFVMKELDIMGSRNAEMEDFIDVIKVIKSGAIPHDDLISKRFKLEDAGEALKYWSEKSSEITKIVIDLE